MGKRGRDEPCFICGHFHNFEEGEVCGVCGHRKAEASSGESQSAVGAHLSAFPTEIVPDFLYLGTYDNASRSEFLKAQGISHILNAVPTCANLYKNSFNYFSMPESTAVPFDECFDFVEQARNGGARVLVHCMSGQSKSPSIVAAYLMRKQGISLQEAIAIVQQLRPNININAAMMEQLQHYELALRTRLADPPSDQRRSQLPQQGGLQFDLSSVSQQTPAHLEGLLSAGNLTSLGGALNGMPGALHGVAAPAFGFLDGVNPNQGQGGFVFGSSQSPQQGSGQ